MVRKLVDIRRMEEFNANFVEGFRGGFSHRYLTFGKTEGTRLTTVVDL